MLKVPFNQGVERLDKGNAYFSLGAESYLWA